MERYSVPSFFRRVICFIVVGEWNRVFRHWQRAHFGDHHLGDLADAAPPEMKHPRGVKISKTLSTNSAQVTLRPRLAVVARAFCMRLHGGSSTNKITRATTCTCIGDE